MYSSIEEFGYGGDWVEGLVGIINGQIRGFGGCICWFGFLIKVFL